jgi:iron complex transport system substrate-binding protein
MVSASILLHQADGTQLELQSSARRLVTLSPNLAELVYAAGAGDYLLATVEYSEYPQAVSQLPRVGDAFRLDIERIVSFRPDLVLAWDSGNPGAAVEQLRSLGITVWAIEIRDPEQIGATLLDIGRATDNESIAAKAARVFSQRLDSLVDRYASVETIEYFYQVDARPLFTVNGDHLISKGLALCGGHNIFAGEPGLAFQVAHESVIVADPAALFAPTLPGEPDPLALWQKWPGMRAVEQGALFTLDADRISRATPRWLDSIETACTLLHDLRRKQLKQPLPRP